ncbi:PREDICTED: lactadherin-like [Branchiostoma belcheri]|uniref:Lactadherin-like n=1 Tax=Branchiostoma belcheri TaxID=7741 RepID=A0A6P4Y0A5_BRABE|nr:PREDICTED: lactadherin-like [Branchiostoma belcheri]
MESGAIPDGSITASSSYHYDLRPFYARLNVRSNGGGWAATTSIIGQWLQVDLGEMKRVTGTIIQGRNRDEQWVTSYKLRYSADGTVWTTYAGSDGSDMVFPGNADMNTPVTNLLDNPIAARYVRFYPQTWHIHMSMRVEILGCSTDIRITSPTSDGYTEFVAEVAGQPKQTSLENGCRFFQATRTQTRL